MKQELEAADGQPCVGCNRQVFFTRTLTYYARRPSLFKQHLVPTIALYHQTLQLHIATVSGDSQIKGDFLHRTNVGEGKPVVEPSHNALRAGLQFELCRQSQFFLSVLW